MAQRVKINMEMEEKAMPWAGFCLSLFSAIYFQLYTMQYQKMLSTQHLMWKTKEFFLFR